MVMQGLILNIYLPAVSTNTPCMCACQGISDWLQPKVFQRLKTTKSLFCSGWLPTMKRQLFKDAGLLGTVLYQYQLKGCLCSILIQGHWIVEHTHMLVSIINEGLSLGCTSKERITLDCSQLLSFSCLFCFSRLLSSQLSLSVSDLLNVPCA